MTKIINLIYLLDYATVYKSVLDGKDPHPVKSIDFIKETEGHYLKIELAFF